MMAYIELFKSSSCLKRLGGGLLHLVQYVLVCVFARTVTMQEYLSEAKVLNLKYSYVLTNERVRSFQGSIVKFEQRVLPDFVVVHELCLG